jgi:hypothetical protein
LRLVVAGQAAVLHALLALADRVRAGLQWMRANPQWVIGALDTDMVLRPRQPALGRPHLVGLRAAAARARRDAAMGRACAMRRALVSMPAAKAIGAR